VESRLYKAGVTLPWTCHVQLCRYKSWAEHWEGEDGGQMEKNDCLTGSMSGWVRWILLQCLIALNTASQAESRLYTRWLMTNLIGAVRTSVKNISIRAEWLRQSGQAQSVASEATRWRITPRGGSIQCGAFLIPLSSQFHHFFSFWRSPILYSHSGNVANCDHTSEWVH